MDLAVRTLREGSAHGGAAPLLLLCDTLATVGGPALLRQAVADLATAIAGGRAQASALILVALERPAAQYQQLCSLTSVSLTVLDCFSDPHSWGSLLGGVASISESISDSSGGAGTVVPLPGILATSDGVERLRQRLAGVQPASSGTMQQCIIIDSLSPLLDRFGPASVVLLLHGLQAAPSTSCLLCGLHIDLHPLQQLAALEQLAAGTLQLAAAGKLEQSLCAARHGAESEPQGRLAVCLKRRMGRVRAETQLYCLDGGGGVCFFELPADVFNPQVVAEKTAAAGVTGSGGEAGMVQQLAGGMKLGLSATELEAKQRVQLPFEHQGQSSDNQIGDFRDNLPPEAGGKARPPSVGLAAVAGGGTGSGGEELQGGQALGHILYVRDSGSEHDSDEDPDDDLDI